MTKSLILEHVELAMQRLGERRPAHVLVHDGIVVLERLRRELNDDIDGPGASPSQVRDEAAAMKFTISRDGHGYWTFSAEDDVPGIYSGRECVIDLLSGAMRRADAGCPDPIAEGDVIDDPDPREASRLRGAEIDRLRRELEDARAASGHVAGATPADAGGRPLSRRTILDVLDRVGLATRRLARQDSPKAATIFRAILPLAALREWLADDLGTAPPPDA